MTLHWYLFRQLAVAAAIAVGGLTFIAIPGVAVKAVHRLGGVGASTVLGYLPLVLTELVPYLLPVGFLLAVVATYGRLAADNEWTAILMAGIHPGRMMISAAALATVLGLFTLWIANDVQPGLKFAQREYLRNAVTQSIRNLSPGQTELSLGPFYLSARNRALEPANTFLDVLIHIPAADDDEEAEERTILAERATISVSDQIMMIELTEWRSVNELYDVGTGKLTVQFNLDALFKVDDRSRRRYKHQDSETLAGMLARGELTPEDVPRARFELQRRNAMGATYLLFVFLGFPTGILLRRGTQLGALSVASCFALLYYLLSLRLGKTLGGMDAIPPPLAAWFTTLLGFLAGILMIRKVFRQ